MGSKIFSFFLNIIIIALALGIGIIAIFVYLGIFPERKEENQYKIEYIVTEKPEENIKKDKTNINLPNRILTEIDINQSNDSIETNSDEVKKIGTNGFNIFFYNQLNQNQKIIYDKLKDNKENLKSGNYIVNFEDAFSNTLANENGNQILGNDYQTAIEAFTHDYPDLFFLDVNKMVLNIETTTKLFKVTYNVYISAKEGEKYLSNDFITEAQIQTACSEIEFVKNTILNNIRGSDYDKILYIHDYLIENIEYDTEYNSVDSYGLYGALVKKRCVCEGYAKAFKYLTNLVGIECEMMQGIATNSVGQTESHAWNCVKLNGMWYEVDCTWDDPIITGGGKLTKDIKYRYFLKGKITFEKDHVNSYHFSDEGKEFTYPIINIEDY